MPPRRAIRGRPTRRNVNHRGQEVVANQAGQQRVGRQDMVDTSKISEFLRMNPPELTRSNITKDSKNFMEELQKVFEVMRVAM
ncbi:hypothetical protein MTR67_023837 [Solanum verrucosum]|uniref:Gag-pol polyprotein n=1 Tax=Solanum verrucosum TaxID=315347 RepID=A0AAF0QXN9_SOLVR|nr:hypothetical protein MTR67_023837 [Solanum verrucosum]